MAITSNLEFTKTQRKQLGKLIRSARQETGRSQLSVATEAFGYKKSHAKISRIERAVMAKVDAHCIERIACTLKIPKKTLLGIDPQFSDRAAVAREATRRGFWAPKAVDTSLHL